MGAAAARASRLIGMTGDFKCTYVVNEILFDRQNGGPVMAAKYLSWGSSTLTEAEGVVIVGTDGKHVGVFISANEFVHASTRRHGIVKLDKSQLKHVFPNGYVYRSEY